MANEHILDMLRAAVQAGQGTRDAARTLGKSYSSLMNDLNPTVGHHKLGLLEALELIDRCGAHADPVRCEIASAMGGMFVELPSVGASCEQSQREALRAVKEFGDVIAEYNKSLADDNRIDPVELGRIEREAHEAQTAIQSFLETVRCEVYSPR